MTLSHLLQRFFVISSAFVLTTTVSHAAVQCPPIFSDHMVIQREMAVPVWGNAAPDEEVTVEFAGQRKTVRAAADGRWQIRLAPLATSTAPRIFKVHASNELTFSDVLVGEVWLASGQSNMEKPIGGQRGQKPTDNAEAEIRDADHPLLRLFQVPRNGISQPDDLTQQWLASTPEAVEKMHFSAAGYFFGRELLRDLKVPIGIIHTSFGGTRIEPWTLAEGFAAVPSLKDFATAAATGQKFNSTIGASLYHSMVEPLVPYALRGFIWYQGESNLMNIESAIYTDKMRALIGGWRTAWDRTDAPFYYVQIAPYRYSVRKSARPLSVEALPMFWEAQTRALAIPHTGMTVITDLVTDLDDIHPTNKRDVGRRLAALALSDTYGRTGIATSGPVFTHATTHGTEFEISFAHAEGLASRDGQALTGFIIAGADRQFVPATAFVHEEKIILTAPEVALPVAARFAWHETTMTNLINGVGLPAWSFRTDDWPVDITGPATPADLPPPPKPIETVPSSVVPTTPIH